MALPLRWSFIGPFETIDLNAPGGIRDYAERYQKIYSNIFPSTQWRADWAGPVMTVVEAERRKQLSADKLVETSGVARSPADGACRTQAARRQGNRTVEQRRSGGGRHGSSEKVIITCAVTGAIHTPSMSPYLPVTADQIAEAAIGAAEAGAAIVHLHARDERNGPSGPTSGGVRAVSPADQAVDKGSGESDDWRGALHDGCRSG